MNKEVVHQCCHFSWFAAKSCWIFLLLSVNISISPLLFF